MILKLKKRYTDVCNNTPSPSIAALERVKRPKMFPKDEKATAFKSCISALLIAKRMAGPGETIATNARPVNNNHVCNSIAFPLHTIRASITHITFVLLLFFNPF